MPGAERRARPVAPARRGDGLARLRPHAAPSPVAPACSPARCCSSGSVGVCVGVYGLLDAHARRALLGLPMLVLGGAARRWRRARARRPPRAHAPATGRTRGRSPEWLVAASRHRGRRRDVRRRARRPDEPEPVAVPARAGRRCRCCRRSRSSSACCRRGSRRPSPPSHPRPQRAADAPDRCRAPTPSARRESA